MFPRKEKKEITVTFGPPRKVYTGEEKGLAFLIGVVGVTLLVLLSLHCLRPVISEEPMMEVPQSWVRDQVYDWEYFLTEWSPLKPLQ